MTAQEKSFRKAKLTKQEQLILMGLDAMVTVATAKGWGWARCFWRKKKLTLTVFVSGPLAGAMQYFHPGMPEREGPDTWFDPEIKPPPDYQAFFALDKQGKEDLLNAQMNAMPGGLLRVVGDLKSIEIVRVFETGEWSKWDRDDKGEAD